MISSLGKHLRDEHNVHVRPSNLHENFTMYIHHHVVTMSFKINYHYNIIILILFVDVFSYDEDDMVEDPNLAQHLAHFGINIAQMEKVSLNVEFVGHLYLCIVQ